MSTLTEAAFFSKKAFFWSVVGISLIVGAMIFLGIGKRIKNALFPPPPVPATVAFGKLPPLNLDIGFKAPGGTTFVLDTITGSFPEVPSYVKVFAIGKPEAFFGAFEQTKTKARNIGFDNPPQEVSSGIFKFVDPRDENKVLTVDTVSGNFTLETDYLVDTDILNSRPQSEQKAVDAAVSFLENWSADLSNFPQDKIMVRKLRIDGGNLTETPALADTHLIEVNFYRRNLDEIPVYFAVEKEAAISVLVSGKDIVFVKYEPPNVMLNKFATYPLRPPASAFEDLRKGLAAFNKKVDSKEVAIIDVSLGYVESEKTNSFMVPAYIFKDRGDLYGYVSAIDPIWLENSASSN